MGLNTYSSRDFTRDVSAAKRAAERSPVERSPDPLSSPAP